MDDDMWRLWFTKLLVISLAVLALTVPADAQFEAGDAPSDRIQATRIERDLQGVTTVLLVSARPGKSIPPVGVLTKTARTFVQDGASTEFATQVLGTTLDNGRLYARILSTSSRVFYDKEPSPDPVSPYVVYPSRPPVDDWQLRVALDNAPIKAIKEIEAPRDSTGSGVTYDNGNRPGNVSSRLDELSRENDIFSKRELSNDSQRFKPAKVRPADNLPTYTVKPEYVSSNAEPFEDDQPKFRPRLPKIFKPQPKTPPQRRADSKPLATVTYHGFADFTTTVGDTVIVFSPSTSPAPAGRPATTIKGDATLRPDDGVAVMKIRPTSVLPGHKKTQTPVEQETDELLEAINAGHVQPSVTEEQEMESSSRSTDPLLLLPDIETGSVKPTGLLKVVDSTTAVDGTTTHYKSLIYGTYIGANYAQIIHTSSNVYFFPDDATASYNDDTTVDYTSPDTDPEEQEQDTTLEMTTGTTPATITTREETPQEMNELTTPFKDTTDSVLTTLKDILESARKVLGTTESALPTIDDDLANDIVPADPQGRSIKGSFQRNNLGNKEYKDSGAQEEKPSLATRLLPSTTYNTFTYFTTFFISDDNDQTTTSVRSREVVSSEVTYLTELILPSATETASLPTASVRLPTTPKMPKYNEADEEQTTKQDEEIELIFKTLYTTYTYLTTFFQENTSSVSSREVVETNVITQTVGPNGVSEAVAGLFERDEPTLISPTKILENVTPSATVEYDDEREPTEDYSRTTVEETTEGSLTTIQDQETTLQDKFPTTMNDEERETTDEIITDLEPSPTPSMSTEQAYKEQVRTYYTTYTYFTTIFVDDETEIETRTEVFTNVVTETIQPTAVVPVTQATTTVTTPKPEPPKPAVPPEILAYLEALQRQKSQEEAFKLAKKVQEENSAEQTDQDDQDTEPNSTTEETTDATTEFPTTLEQRSSTENFRDFQVNAQVTPNPPVDGEVLGSMVTDVVSSSSSGGETVLDVMDKRNAVPEDQELSESNHHEVEPAPTLLLQTSYTTFTYFTTMYKGDESTVNSRLETVTNIVTETIRPSAVLSAETSTLPVTYFTTFTYWTTFYKGGDTLTTSREETVSNVVTPGVSPTPTVELGVIMTYRPTVAPTPVEPNAADEKESKVTADNEVTPSDIVLSEKPVTEDTTVFSDLTTSSSNQSLSDSTTTVPEPTTYYTTYTYFTTSYIGNETILNSRLETVTSVSIPQVLNTVAPQVTGRAIDGPVYTVQSLNTEEKTTTPSKVVEAPKTGLISTIRSSQVYDGTTTHYATDVYGTYIDGLYAQVVESTTRLETPTLSSSSSSVATPVLPTGVLSLNKGRVIDADEVTTVYFTTKQIGTLFDGLYAKVIESTSSTKIDEERKSTIPPTHGHRTGLVRLIQGQIENNGTTTFYQSKVIGTSIDGRYAQIIESTSSFLAATPTLNISPTSTLPPTKPTGLPEVSPSPAVIQSSLSEDPTTESADLDEDSEQNEEDDEEEEEDDDGSSSKKKSRLTFSTRKRTFTPVIRPFISRNRPTFNPKRKGAQGATTITRTDITPTITATLAGKGNRFASSRRVTSPIGPYSSSVAPTNSRRFSGRRIAPTSSSSYASSSTRGRGQSRASASSVYQGSRRGPSSIRGSSTRAAARGSSSVYPGASSRYRGIRPSSTLQRGQSTVRHDDQENDANEFTTTTLVTEETPYTEYTDGGETVTAPLTTTTESSRRSTNPLLRFRRPLNLNGSSRGSTTPRPPSSTTSRRNGNLNRPSTPTIPNRANGARSSNRGTVPPISTRPRQGGTGLFPPRGLFGRKQESPADEQVEPNDEFEGEDNENFEDDPVEEIEDNDYEGSEHEARASSSINRRSGKSLAPVVQIRPFAGYGRRRVRRQASQLRTLSSRFRRPNPATATKAEDSKSDTSETSASKEDSGKTASKPVSRYNSRGRSLTTSRPHSGSKPEKASAESVENSSQQNKARTRTKQPSGRTSSSRIKPTPASGSSRQFTLREKDTPSSSRSSYKRPSSSRSNSRSSNKSTESGSRVRPPRLRSGSKSQTESPLTSRRVPSRSSSRSSSRNGRRPSQRGRGSHEDIRDTPFVQPDFDGTITVTHYVPTEVTIPVVNNGVTEHRNIITAQPSTEVLKPSQYSTVVGGDGRPLVVIVSEVTGTNVQGQTEITRFLLHETPTTRVSHTLTTLGGRRASQSVIIPSTIYSVENVVSTIQPSLPGNSPLANILLSQLLLGQLGQANPLLQPQATPTTQYNTRTTSYVTTITKHQSTVIPLTFRGKEILTTLVDSTTDVVTATEFITDTVVVTPTAAIPAANLNSLLLLLQQPQPQQQQSNPLLDPLFAAAPLLTQSNTLPGEVERRHQPADSDYKPDASYEYSEEEDDDDEEYEKPAPKSRNSRGRNEKRDDNPTSSKAEYSVITLYVSGRRPGEFTTVLSTVKATEEVSASRRRRDIEIDVHPSQPPSLHAGSEDLTILSGSEDPIEAHAPTQSLESVVDDELDDRPNYFANARRDQAGLLDNTWSNSEDDDVGGGVLDDADEYPEAVPRKRVRIRVPVVRSRNGRQHKLTVVRRRPLVPYTREQPAKLATAGPRRIVVTRVRPLGAVNTNTEDEPAVPIPGRHKVTITRRRKIQPTTVSSALKRARITRKKLVAVRPIEPTTSFAIITSGFFSAPSEYDDEYADDEEDREEEQEEDDEEEIEERREEVSSTYTPLLEETPNLIDNKPEVAEKEEEEQHSPEIQPQSSDDLSSDTPIIITDNFFFPASNDEEEEYEDYDDESTEEPTVDEAETTTPAGTDDTSTSKHAPVSVSDEKTDTVTTNEPDAQFEVTTIRQSAGEGRETEEEDETDEATTVAQKSTTSSNQDTPTEAEVISTTMQDDDAETTLPPTDEVTEHTEKSEEETTVESTTEAEETTEQTTEQSAETTTVPPTTESSITTTTEVEQQPPRADTEPSTTEKLPESPGVATESPQEEDEESKEHRVEEDTLTVKPLSAHTQSSTPILPPWIEPSDTTTISSTPIIPSVIPLAPRSSTIDIFANSYIPSVIPLGGTFSSDSSRVVEPASVVPKVTTTIASPTPEDIEAGLADDLYLSLSRPDIPEILPSKAISIEEHERSTIHYALEPSTSVYYTETVVTSTRLRTYTYVVTKQNGLETKVTSSTTVRPRVTTITLTVPVTVTVTPTVESSADLVSSVYNPVPTGEYEARDEEEGRRFNLATRIMSNGVEVIVAGPTPALRWENSNPQPTLTLSDAVVMLLPQDKPNEFVTKTCTTTFTYLSTITKDGTTTVSTEQQVVANTATEERHRKPGSETAAVTLEASPTLRTEVFKTTYTYLTLNTDHPNVDDALESSTKVIANTVTAPQHYLDMILEPSEAPRPETNTYLSTRVLEKTFMEDGRTRVETTSESITQLIVTESAPPPRPTSVTTTLTALDNTDGAMTDVMKTYYITYTYFNTFLEKGSTVVRTNIATSTDVVLEKVPVKKTSTKMATVSPTPEPIQIFATKTYLTTFTYFTTLLQAGPDGETSTTVSSRSHIVENVVTESIAPSLLDAGYMNALLTTVHHSDPVKNVVTGSTIIFFDEDDQIDPTTSSEFIQATPTVEIHKDDEPMLSDAPSEASNSTPMEHTNNQDNGTSTSSSDLSPNKRPQNGGDLQVSNLLSLGSLGINSLSALGPVITAMAGLLQGKTSASRRNDTVSVAEAQEVTTQRSPIYIPVAEFADGDIEAAESQHIAAHLANLNHNYIAETRHKVTASLADGIPISPGEVITANSDVIIGKPGKMGPRPPQTFLKGDENIGMKPPPLPVPNIPVHPILEVLEDHREDAQPQQTIQTHLVPQVQILPAHQVYEEHLKIPVSGQLETNPQTAPKQTQKLHAVPPKKIGSKHDVLENDPLLKPPDRLNVEQYANPSTSLKIPEWNPEKMRRPWSAKDPLNPPPPPRFEEKVRPGKPIDKTWPANVNTGNEDQKYSPWAQKDPLHSDGSAAVQTVDSKPTSSEPIVHQVPHVIDRSTGQPLLVNIQPSQVANIVIPQGGTKALIFGDTSEPHISGQYFDDPSPYPEPEVGPGFVGIQRVEDLPQYSTGNDPADYMVPPSPPQNYKPLSQKVGSSSKPQTIPLSPVRFEYARPQDKLEAPVSRPDKRPEVHLIKRPDGSGGSNGQGHVHSEILVHHRPETVNIRPHSHVFSGHQLPPRGGHYTKVQKPSESGPPRRTEPSVQGELPHRYIFIGKPEGNEITLNTNWKSDKKPPRITLGNRVRPRPPLRPTTNRPHERPVYMERPTSHPVRKVVYTGPQRQGQPPKTQNSFVQQHRPAVNGQGPQDTRKPVNTENRKESINERPTIGHSPIDLQDRPPHSQSEKTSAEQPERNEDVVPTGAVEYHNPSDPKENPVKQGQNNGQQASTEEDRWHSKPQTEKTLPDSDTEASEYVKYQNQFNNQKDDKKNGDKENVSNNSTTDMKNSYVAIGSVSTVVGRPMEVEQGTIGSDTEKKPYHHSQGQAYGQKKDEFITQGNPYGTDYYNTRPYDTPVVQGKPFGVYNDDHINSQIPYGYKRKDGRPGLEIVQAMPAINFGDKKLSVMYKTNSDGQETTSKPYERDDTIDLKPPAIIPQFSVESGRPYPRPHIVSRPDTKPLHYQRPEIITKPPLKIDIRPNYTIKRPVDHQNIRPGTFNMYKNESLDQGGKIGQDHVRPSQFNNEQSRPTWNADRRHPEMHGHQQKIPLSPQDKETDTRKDNFANNTVARPTQNYPNKPVELNRPTNRPTNRRPEQSPTRVHPEYPHILTKPKPQVPGPVTITSSSSKSESNKRPNIKFSMPVEAMGEETESKTQTERPPSMLITKNNSPANKKHNDETLETAYQTNFATSNFDENDSDTYKIGTNARPMDNSQKDIRLNMEDSSVPSTDIMPPPLRPTEISLEKKKEEDDGLKPPPLPSTDVVGLSPPPVDITTTNRPLDDRFSIMLSNEAGMKLPPKYIPLKESVGSNTPPPLRVNMVPPSPRPSLAKPFLVELLSQDMVPPPPVSKTTRPLEIATVRPAVAVSGSIQIATAVATSHIPVIQDIESKIPIIHGTIDLPVVVDVPEILRPVETKLTEHVSIYTVRPFDTRPVSRTSIQPTSITTTSRVMPTKLRLPPVDHILPSPSSTNQVIPTKSHSTSIPPNPVKRPEHPVFLESSHENIQPTTRQEPTESLTYIVGTDQNKEHRSATTTEQITKTHRTESTETHKKNNTKTEVPTIVTKASSSTTKVTSTSAPSIPEKKILPKRNETTVRTTKEIIGSVTPVVMKNATSRSTDIKPKEVTRFKTSTVTRVDTSVLGSPPTTRTLLLTHTMTSTTIETVTETLLRPTSVVSTITSTILQSIITRVPANFDNVGDNDSIFVVLSDKKPPSADAEEVEAEYGGEEDISRDEQDPTGNEIHRVLAGGVLGAPIVPLQPPINQCAPECRASKAEVCAEVGTEMRCVCRPGFARMFPDRPCKPTYTYTLKVGLERIGQEPVMYDVTLNDTASPMYRRLATPIKDSLDRTLMQSDLRDVYRGLKISGFSPDPTKVEFHVQLSDNANETRLKEVLRKYLVGSNYSLGGTEVFASKNLDMIDAVDFDECATEDGGPHHDCSPNAACFNLRGSYQCSCKEGWADLSENPAYPGRVCSQAPLGCAACNNKGHCVTNIHGQEVCECFPWHSGQRCQVNLKVLLIALVTTGAILLGLLAVCVGLACFRRPDRSRKTGDRRAMIPGTGGDTSSEGSVTDLAIPHHAPHVLPPPPQMIAPLPPTKRPARKISQKQRNPPRKATMIPPTVPMNDEQRDRSLTVMIPRARYRSAPQSPQNFKSGMSTFAADDHKLLNYLETGSHAPTNRKQSISSTKDCKEADLQAVRSSVTPTGALVSAGFQVSATVTRTLDADSTLARSCGETTVETATKVIRSGQDLAIDVGSTLARSCGETTIQAPTKLLRLDLGEAGSTLARSCGETTIQPPTKVAATRRSSVKDTRDNRDTRDSASEGHTMAERDLGSTLRLPAQHPPLYSPDRTLQEVSSATDEARSESEDGA